MDYYTILGVGKNATKQEIRKAYLSLAKKFHPDKYISKEQAENVQGKFSLIAKAYNTLLDSNKRSEYDKTLMSSSYKEKVEKAPRTIQAKMAFKNGLTHYKKGDFWRAEKYFKSAISLSPDSHLYKSYLGLALVRQKRRKDEGLKYCKDAVESEIYNSHFHVNLGIVYKILGDTENAIKCFEEALAWNESDERATKQLEKMKGKMKKNNGFLSRFFKKGG